MISRSAVASAAALLIACASVHGEHASAGVPFSDDRTIIQVATTNVGGKNFFVPSTIVLTAAGRSLSFFNTTANRTP